MSDLERHIKENWSQMSPSERMFAMMDLGEENGVKPITADEWMEWAISVSYTHLKFRRRNKQEVNNVST